MKSVLISIQPKWCELIASGKKTVEVRKTKPKLETPFKVYIYCTQGQEQKELFKKLYKYIPLNNRVVIGEFVCDKITEFSFDEKYNNLTLVDMSWKSCLTKDEIADYSNGQYIVFGWHISDLVIYDKPKELSEFFKACDKPKGTDCSVCIDHRENRCKAITRPPQSWCYVESIESE